MTGAAVGPLLGVAWAALVATLAFRRRPHRHRARELLPGGGGRRSRITLVELGRALLRRPDADALVAARAGAVAMAGVLCAGPTLLAPGLLVVTGPLVATAWLAPALTARRRAATDAIALEAALPEVVDLLSVAVGAGLNVHLAVQAVARRATGPVAAALGDVHRATRAGMRLGDALYELLATRPPPEAAVLRPLVTALVDADRYGTSLTASLERLSDDVRRTRQRRAEEAARRVPVKLLFPLVLCVLPAFALLTVAPVLAGSLRALRL